MGNCLTGRHFRQTWIQPAAGDEGFGHWRGSPHLPQCLEAVAEVCDEEFLPGPEYSDAQIEAF